MTMALMLGACSSDDGSEASAPRWLDDVEAELPSMLSAVGLFSDVAARVPNDDVRAYEPNFPLYSNGLAKERLAHFSGPPNAWEFPVGTLFAKTFTLDDEPIETRLLFLRAEGWDYALYAWDGADAALRAGNWAEETLSLQGGQVTHTLPSRLDCRTCHETSEEVAGHAVLGVGPYQTGEDLLGAFDAPPELLSVDGRTGPETEAFEYFIGNCVSCHTGGEATNASFSLYPEDAVANTVNQETESETGAGIRVVPGDPQASVLFITVVSAREPDYQGPFKAMPPIGVDTTDPAAASLLESWIDQL